MATEDDNGGGGGGLGRKLGPFPLWAWALIAGGAIGLIWIVRSKPTAAATDDATSTDDTGSIATQYQPGGGMSTAQWAQLEADLASIQGQLSTPPPDTTPPVTLPPAAGQPVKTTITGPYRFNPVRLKR